MKFYTIVEVKAFENFSICLKLPEKKRRHHNLKYIHSMEVQFIIGTPKLFIE